MGAWGLGSGPRTAAQSLAGPAAARTDRRAGGGWVDAQDVDLLAVAVGPGSFTGPPRGLATMQDWPWTLGRPLLGVSSLEALARCCGGGAWGSDLDHLRLGRRWRGEAYTGLYRHGQELRPATVGAPADAVG